MAAQRELILVGLRDASEDAVRTDAASEEAAKPRRSLLTGATEAVTALVSAAGLVYVLGDAVLALRLWVTGVPPEAAMQAAIAPVPKEYAITVALSEIVGPGVILGLASMFLVLFALPSFRSDVLSREPKTVPADQREAQWRGRKRRIAALLAAVTLLLLAPGALGAVANHGTHIPAQYCAVLAASALATFVAVALARLGLNGVICHATPNPADEEPRREVRLHVAYKKLEHILPIGAIMAALGMMASLTAVGARPFASATIYPAKQDAPLINGRLIAESDANTYLVVGHGSDKAVLSMRNDDIARVVIRGD